MAVSEPSKLPTDRRRHPRAATKRHAIFSGIHERALITPGETVDISLTGLQVRCHTPEPAGTAIDLELHAKSSESSSDPILVRGRVVYVRPIDQYEYCMGIRLEASALPAGTPSPAVISSIKQARELIQAIQHSLKTTDGAAQSPIAFLNIQHVSDSADAREVLTAITRKRARRTVFFLAATLFVALALWLLRSEMQAHVRTTGDGSGPYRAKITAESPSSPREAGLSAHTGAEDNGAAVPDAPLPPIESVKAILDSAQDHIDRGDTEGALLRIAEVSAYPTGSALERFLGEFGQAQALAALDRPDEATETLNHITGAERQLPQPWHDAAVQMRQAIAAHDPAAVAALRFHDALQLDSNPETATPTQFHRPPAPGTSPESLAAGRRGLWLQISKHDYVLTVYRDGTPMRQFPVGLGLNGATPQGTFYIVNRITNPDWFDRGRVVETGDPENPLGSRWMGLGNQTGPTSYGIHPTGDPESIRANRSRGCIRMRPADAEVLFDLCAIGTPVLISDD